MIPIAIIILAWGLNAAMDAVDHAKGAADLGVLWHALKWLSYALPFAYIIFTQGWGVSTLIIVCMALPAALFLVWETLYYIFRTIDLSQWDR
ncbi:MAG: hypothetical protein PHQ43_04515 [Dehalococcoidales bacterium]|nr:hypothetical protein [Dehalococcoidales bacterium]